jgi:hypothetical protein
MPISLDMNKATGNLRLALEKRGIMTPPVVEVAFDFDCSGSYEDEHINGSTNDLLTRLTPWGLLFDPDKQLDMFAFSDRSRGIFNPGPVNESNYQGFVKKHIIGCPVWRGGTDYAPVLRANLEAFGWIESAAAPAQKRGWFGGGKPAPVQAPVAKRRSLILFNTDGANNDKRETEALFEQMEREKYGVYVAFIAYDNDGADFSFINRLAERFNNCGLVVIENMKEWVKQSDDQINNAIISDELVTWLKN